MTNGDGPAAAPDVWDSSALLAKSQRYLETMLELPRSDWQFGLLSSLALELLARAALSKISPTLLADLGDWNNLYYALGKTPKAKKFVPKSVAVSQVLSRLNEILPDFDSELYGFCSLHINRRNAELHSAEPSFEGVKHSSWLPTYYRSCSVLLESMGEDLAQFLGTNEYSVAQKLIYAAADETAKTIKGTIKGHKTVWMGKDKGEQELLGERASLWASSHVGHRVQCPACNSNAIVTGEPISTPVQRIENDIIIEKQQYLPSKFECIACGMRISGFSQLTAAGLGDAYTRTQEYDPVAYYELDDAIPDWEEDFNEPI